MVVEVLLALALPFFFQALLFRQESSCTGTVVRMLALSRFLRRSPSTCSFNFCFQSHLNQTRSSFCRPISSVQGQNVNHRDRRSDWIEFKILRLLNFFLVLSLIIFLDERPFGNPDASDVGSYLSTT